jgi:predicted Ser/Thr protein kinase
MDNEHGDLIIAVADEIVAPDGRRFEVLGHLGKGTFGQVLKVRAKEGADQVFALKIIRNRMAFRRQAETEVELVRGTRGIPAARPDLTTRASQLYHSSPHP